MKKFLLAAILATLAVCSSCGGSNSSGGSSGTLQSIQVSPAATSQAVGANPAFTATGTFSGGGTQDLTSSVNWSSSSNKVATISSAGVATCVAAGTATITAKMKAISGSAALTVTGTAPVLTSITVSPANSTLMAGQTLQFIATGSYSDGSTQVLTSSATWSSSNATAATIASGGLATAVNPGTTKIIAADSSTGITGTTTLTVTGVLVSIAVSPLSPSIAPGTTQQFTATGYYSDNSSQNLNSVVTWSSSATNVATVSNTPGTQGLATAVAPGLSSIRAALGAISGSTNLTVSTATLQSIAVTPASPQIPLGVQQQFTATGSFSNGTMQVITNTVSWSSSSNSVMSVTQSGLGTAKDLGSATITATSGSVTGSTLATVNAANLLSITITAPYSTIADNTSEQLTATGLFDDGSTSDLTGQVTWTSLQPSFATVNGGLAQGLAPGSTTITARLGSISNSNNFVLTVTDATVSSIVVTPTGQTIPVSSSLVFTAAGVFSDASSQNISGNVTWSSSNTAIATISNLSGSVGSATGVAAGTANINATFEGVSGSTPLNISSATLQSITLSPSTAVLAPALSLQYAAVGHYSNGSTRNLKAAALNWTSSAPSVASVSSNGYLTGQSAGSATITAATGALSATASVVVESSAPVSITVTTPSPQVPVGILSTFTATGNFADGSQTDITSTVNWTSSPVSVATISNASGSEGYATGVSAGSATVDAIFDGVVGTGSLTVTNATLNSIALSPSDASIAVGASQQFTATGTFSDGTVVPLTFQVDWTSSQNHEAVISSSGIATGDAPGTVTITAFLDGITGTATLTVQ